MREWLQERLGVAGAGVLCVLALGALAYFGFLKKPDAVRRANERTFICSETGKTFGYTLKDGDRYPVESPHSGNRTGWPAEACYWTADGGAKREPIWVLLNENVGKEGPTICPDCGRKVVRFNPSPPREKWDELAAREREQGKN